ncbi:hypothetical protein B4083_2745 [Bacillus cereus]|nr:hypothetical protein B4083_2745 [Bacillus cereus]
MKLTLFTTSNEQIKEQLSKLQTKVESLETVKEVQDKIIATKDSQIAFLNGQIANIWAPIAIATAVILSVFVYVAWLNRQAQKKVEQAESLINNSHSIATIAQEKIDELEVKQNEFTILTSSLITNQKADISLKGLNFALDFIRNALYDLEKRLPDLDPKRKSNELKVLNELKKEHDKLRAYHIKLELQLTHAIKSEKKIDDSYIESIEQLQKNTDNLNIKILNYMDCVFENE